MRACGILLVAAACASPGAAPSAGGFSERKIELAGRTHRYAVWLPSGYDRARAWPLVVFLHGKGECGDDGMKQTTVGLGPALQARSAEWPCVVLFPQKPTANSQWEDHEEIVWAELAATLDAHRIDRERISLTGLSQGGHGTLTLGAKRREGWSALAPVCGYGDPKLLARELAWIPIWAFHGEADPTVPVAQTLDLAQAIRRVGGDELKVTTYPGVAHNCWDRAYRTEGLAAWLLAQTTSPFRHFRF